ncbi:MAG: hypothetical protein HZB79_00635 [Deltaproteobacteria bacterium]|nr:hypothetical protein [Deltaproteobacteria bacterium]
MSKLFSKIRLAKIFITVLALVGALVFNAYFVEAESLEKAIVGKWQDKNGGVWEYLEGGTLLIGGGGDANYKIISNGRLMIKIKAPAYLGGDMVEVMEVSISNDELKTIDSRKHVDIFKRVK